MDTVPFRNRGQRVAQLGRSPVEYSLGVMPNQAISCGAEAKREISPISAMSPTATLN